MATPPPELADGQDDPPDLDQLLHVLRVFLYDVREQHGGDDDLGLRSQALRNVVIRAIQARGGES